MKTYKFTATGNLEINDYSFLKINGKDIIEPILESIKIDTETHSKEFAGKVEITITDLTEPLKIDAQEV